MTPSEMKAREVLESRTWLLRHAKDSLAADIAAALDAERTRCLAAIEASCLPAEWKTAAKRAICREQPKET